MQYIKTYQQAVDFIQNLTNLHHTDLFDRQDAHVYYKKRMDVLLNLLDNPQDSFKFVHVSGTNGKGSTVTMLSSILHAAGKKVGSYTSPHVCTFAERIKVGHSVISADDLVRITNQLKPILEKYFNEYQHDGLTFTELVLLVSLIYFKEEKCKYVVIEVGCGGKNDATNIIPAPEIAIITNIGLDHVQAIGPTLEDIAIEKSGIIKNGSYFLTQEKDNNICTIFKNQCDKVSATFGTYIRNYEIIEQELTHSKILYNDNEYHISLSGKHQIQNALLCINAATHLSLPTLAIQEGLKNARIPGRFEIMQKSPMVILDGAHNADKFASLINQFNGNIKNKRIWVLFSSTDGDKINTTLKGITELADEIICTRHSMTFRKAANPKDLLNVIKKIKPKYKPKYFLIAQEGFDYIIKNAKSDDIIVVTGSLYMIGLIRERWISENHILKSQILFK